MKRTIQSLTTKRLGSGISQLRRCCRRTYRQHAPATIKAAVLLGKEFAYIGRDALCTMDAAVAKRVVCGANHVHWVRHGWESLEDAGRAIIDTNCGREPEKFETRLVPVYAIEVREDPSNGPARIVGPDSPDVSPDEPSEQ